MAAAAAAERGLCLEPPGPVLRVRWTPLMARGPVDNEPMVPDQAPAGLATATNAFTVRWLGGSKKTPRGRALAGESLAFRSYVSRRVTMTGGAMPAARRR